jgi:hypothetical protein
VEIDYADSANLVFSLETAKLEQLEFEVVAEVKDGVDQNGDPIEATANWVSLSPGRQSL